MIPSPAKLLRGLALFALVIAWAVLAHLGSAGDGNPDFSTALAIAPFVALFVILLWRVGNPLWIAAASLTMLGLIAWTWPALRNNVPLLYFVQHLGTNLALGALFGRTLFAPHEALVSQFARLAHGGVISDLKARYTRQVTIAWSIFFAANALVSSFLFWLLPAADWSLFANLLTVPLLGLMFVIEHLFRYFRLPADERSSIADTIRGYRASMQQRHSTTQVKHP